MRGKNNPNWMGGVTPQEHAIRNSTKYQEWRRDVFRRDNRTCKICGQPSEALKAHHIRPFAAYPELRLDVNNGITCCEICHVKIHKKISEELKNKRSDK